MLKRRLKKALTLTITLSLAIDCMAVTVHADQDKSQSEISIVVESDPSVVKATGSASTISTGTQTDARDAEDENKANNPSEYDKVNGDTEDSEKGNSSNNSEEDNEEPEIVWEEIHIATADDFVTLAKNCRLDTYSANKKVYLDADISMTGVEFEGIPYFNGYFYGQNHYVRNVFIKGSRSYQGFFNIVDSKALISGLNISGYVTPTGAQTIVGGIAGSNKGIISECSFEGTVSGEDYIGGIAGINELSGIIIDSKSLGDISGVHFTGGIAGENMGNIISSSNEANINTVNKDSAVSVEDISVDSILAEVGIGDADKDEAESSAMINGVVDMGGIAGLSIGVIQGCNNKGNVGYPNVGYNVGGIAGRQSGYIFSSTNTGTILGRKDVGGIVGQAEPYVTIDFANDITTQLSDNIEKLHDILEVTLNDAGSSSDTVSARLSVIKTFTDQALTDVRYLENETIDWANGVIATANEAISRADYIMDEATKKDGVVDKTKDAASDAKTAMSQFETAIEHVDIYKYLSEDEKIQYDNAKSQIIDATDEHSKYVDEVYSKMYNYYIDEYKYTSDFATGEVNETDLAYKNDLNEIIKDAKNHGGSGKAGTDYKASVYSESGKWVHCGAAEDGTDTAFPGGSTEQLELDNSLISKASKEAGNKANIYADEQYFTNHGTTYVSDIENATEVISSLTLKYSDKMTEDTKNDAKKAIDSLKSATSDLQSAGSQTKDIITTLNSKSDLSLPSFCSDYKLHANSLTNNIQGMSDNFGILNQEMNNASDNLVDDLKGVNDQFNVIMMLFTDAIDGVLDNDYSNTYTDNSLEVCKTTTDATIDMCTNAGKVEGSINVSGICGTMAIEYDFDLESDVTGVKDAAMNKSYQTKCVLRDDINYGDVTATKNYAGGVCGLQELGTITGGQNYSTITSTTASYVGGIAGSSVSSIVGSFSKCTLSGKSYVGGICGDGARIYDSLSMVIINDADEWYGAVAGHVDDNSDIRNNFFIGDELAGIDRVSYEGEAEPISYEEIGDSLVSVPLYFSNIFVTYVLDEDPDSDDDEIILLRKQEYGFGQSIGEEEYPSAPEKEGYYVEWDIPSIDSVANDMVVTATYVRNNTTLAGDIVRLSHQSAILVDGTFKEGDHLNTTLCISEEDALPNMIEYWDIEIPEDGMASHVIRYAKPENIEEWPDVYVCKSNSGGDSWEIIDSAEISEMGSYEMFSVEGNKVKIQMVRSEKQKRRELIKKIVEIVIIIVGIVILIAIFLLIGRSKKRVQKKVKKRAQEIKDKAEAREPAIKFIDESDLQDVSNESENESESGNDNSDDKNVTDKVANLEESNKE